MSRGGVDLPRVVHEVELLTVEAGRWLRVWSRTAQRELGVHASEVSWNENHQTGGKDT